MRRAIVRAPFADMDAHAFAFQFLPGDNAVAAQGFLIDSFLPELERPGWHRPFVRTGNPICLVVAHFHRIVTARALPKAQLHQPGNRVAPPAQAIRDDEPLRVFVANGLHQPLHHAHISFFGHVGRFIQQIKTHLRIRHTLESPGQHPPLKCGCGECDFVRPQIQRLLRRVHAITWRAMQVEIHVNFVFPPVLDRLVKMHQLRFADLAWVLGGGPAEVRNRQAREVKAPLVEQREIAFSERRTAVLSRHALLRQVESAPARQPPGRGLGSGGLGGRQGRKAEPREGNGGKRSDEGASVHNSAGVIWVRGQSSE